MDSTSCKAAQISWGGCGKSNACEEVGVLQSDVTVTAIPYETKLCSVHKDELNRRGSVIVLTDGHRGSFTGRTTGAFRKEPMEVRN